MRYKHFLVNSSSLLIAIALATPAWPAESIPAESQETLGPSSEVPVGMPVQQPPAPYVNGGSQQTSLPSSSKARPTMALTLAGGGARGAAHIGVLKVLDAEGIRPDFISGSSMGALIGALYSAGVPIAEIEHLMLSGKIRKAFFPAPLKLVMAAYVPKYALLRMLQLKPDIGLYSGRKIAKFIDRNLPSNISRVEQLKIPMTIIATNILDTRPVWIKEGDIGEAVRASNAMPYIYKAANIDGKLLVDGGMRANLPTDPAKATGSPLIVAVKLHSSLDAKPASHFKGMLDYSDRIVSIMMAEIESKNVADADILIEPNIQDYQLHSFKREILERAIAEGEAAARKALPQLRERLQLVKNTSAMKF